MWETRLSREMKKWTWRTIWLFTWMARWTHYKVEEMRWEAWARSFHPFCENFCVGWVLCLLGWCYLFGCGFVLLSKPVERLLQVIPGSPFFAFGFLEGWPTMPVLARQCRKKKEMRMPERLSLYCLYWNTIATSPTPDNRQNSFEEIIPNARIEYPLNVLANRSKCKTDATAPNGNVRYGKPQTSLSKGHFKQMTALLTSESDNRSCFYGLLRSKASSFGTAREI